MDVETAIQAFVSAGNDLPREAMQWTLDHWDTVAPELLGTLERYTSGADRSDEAARAVLFILTLRARSRTRACSRCCAVWHRTGRPLRRRWVTAPRSPSSRS